MAFLAGFFGDGEQRLPYQPLPMPQRFLQPVPVNEAQTNEAYRTILAQKQGWENANKAATWWTKQLETPDLTDEQKQVINTNIEGWTQARDDFAKDAQRSRDLATSLGIDVSNYGEGKSLQDANRSYANFRNTAVRDFLNLPTVREQEENRYLELRNKGASPSMARSIIRDEREGRQEKFLQQMGNGIMTYGRDPDGSINEVGLQMAQRINPASPETAMALFVGSLPTIKDAFTAKNTRDNALLAINAADKRNREQLDFNYWNASEDRQLRERITDKTIEAQGKIADAQETARNNRELLKLEAEKAKAYLDSPMGKFDSWYTLGLNLFGGDKRKAADWAKYQVEKKPPNDSDEKIKAAANLFGNRFRDIETALKAGDKDLALQRIDAMTGLLRDDSNYAELLDMGSYTTALKILDVYKKVANREYTLNQAIIEIEELKGGKMSPDQIMAYLMNNGLYGQDDPEIKRRKINQAISGSLIPDLPQWNYTPSGNYSTPQYQGNWSPK